MNTATQKRVLISILQLHKTAAGAMRNTFEQIRYFKSRGYEVHVICDLMNKGSVRAAGAIPHLTLKWPGTGTRRRKFYNWQAQLWIKWNKPDLVVGHGDLSNQDVLCLHNSVHLAHELIHGAPLPETAEMWPIHTPQLRDKKFKHLIANSHLMKNDLVKRFGIAENLISVVYPAYDDQKFTPVSSQDRTQIRSNLGVTASEQIVGLITSGNFKKRGVDIFFEALQLLPDELKQKTRFWVVGKDKLPATPAGVRVEQKPVVTDVENYYCALDLFVLPARVEEFGRVQLEAMACGAPIISTAQVGASELLQGEARAFIMERPEPQALAMMIEKSLQDASLRKRVSDLSCESAKIAAESQLAPLFDSVYKRFL